MNSTRLTRGGRSPETNDAHLTALNAATDPQSILTACAALLEARGMRAPWALPELVPLPQFIASHLKRKEKKATEATMVILRGALTKFQKHCRGMNLQDIKGQTVQEWVDSLEAAHFAGGTIKKLFSAVHAMFTRAVSMGFMRTNPCSDVELPDQSSVVGRQPLLDADIDRLVAFLREQGHLEWITVTLLGRYAGCRLEDAAKMPVSAIRLEGDVTVLSFTPRKTSTPLEVPVFGPLAAHLRQVRHTGPLCPSLATLSVSCLSRHFVTLLDKAGVCTQPVTLANGRVAHQISFHSLRHGFVTSLAVKGIPENLRMSLAGHRTAGAHRRYSHLTAADLSAQLAEYFPS